MPIGFDTSVVMETFAHIFSELFTGLLTAVPSSRPLHAGA